MLKRVLLRLWNDSDSVFIAVEDSGPGISNEDLTRLFKPFASTKQTSERLGLGLALSYEMIKTLGGTIEVRNISPGGAEFTVRIPEFKCSEQQE